MKANIEQIHESLVNGQRQQMVEQIDEYGVYDFWSTYQNHLADLYDIHGAYEYFTDAVRSYFRIKAR